MVVVLISVLTFLHGKAVYNGAGMLRDLVVLSSKGRGLRFAR